jgi:hypothetical protein
MSTEGASRRTFALLAIWWGLFLVSYGVFLVRTPAHRQEVVRAVTQLSSGYVESRVLLVPLALVTFAFWAACRLVRISLLAIVPLGMMALILGVLGPQLEWTRQESDTLRCRIAIGHWDEALGLRLRQDEPLPPGVSAAALFADLARLLGHPAGETGAAWLCPGRAVSTEPETGYVYVGGGLATEKAVEAKALLLFCAAGSHPDEHAQHAILAGAWPEVRGCSPAEIARLIEQALEQAKSGALPYAEEAVALLKRELDARRGTAGD